MPTPLAIAIFLLGLGASLGASEVLVRGLARLGTKLGLAAGLIGLLTALGADSPEISSAITAVLRGAKDVGLGVILGSNLFNLAALLGFSTVVAGQIGFRRILLWLDGGVALWATLMVGLLFLVGLAPVLSLLLILVVFGIYVMLLVVQPHRVDRLALPARVRHRLAVASWGPVWRVVPAVAVIAGGSYAMVSGALALGDNWHIPRPILGAVGLAVITSLPNAYAATRLALFGNGTAVVSLAFNSNTLNLVAGVAIPAVFIGGLRTAPDAALDIAWLLAMTLLAIGLGWWRGGLDRPSGLLLIAVYALFLIFALR